jgi:hypothetical protein
MVNIESGLKFIVDLLNIDYTNIPAAFSFRFNPDNNTNIVEPDPWAIDSASGVLNSNEGGSFFSNFGTGFFNGNNYFKLSKDYFLEDSTIFISYEKLRNENEILLSSVTGSYDNTFSGFYVGVNNANKIYLKYWNSIEGVFTFTYKNTLSNKNLIVINRTNSIITIGHFNNNNFEFEIEKFELFNGNFTNSNDLYVGGSPQQINWGINNLNNFSGYIDRLYIFNNTPFIYANDLARGLYSEPTGFNGQVVEDCFTSGFLSGSGFSSTGIIDIVPSGIESGVVKITGYEEITSGYFYTGITGYETNILGSYIDNCGISIDVIEETPLTGLIYDEIITTVPLTGIETILIFTDVFITGTITGIENVFVTQDICTSYFDISGGVAYVYDENYLSSLAYREISLLKQVESNSFVEIFLQPYSPETLEYNVDLIYDRLNSNYFYIEKEFSQNEILLFGNGQALIDDGFKLVPSGYEFIKKPDLDYFITGFTIETNKFFGEKDYLFYDYFTGSFWGFKNTGNSINLPTEISLNYWVFYNGQKLVLNKDYIINNNEISLIDVPVGEENFIIIKEIPDNFHIISGNTGSFEISPIFNHGCSQVYFNGVKQKLKNNYIENSNFDLISGKFFEPNQFHFLIYNNTNDFFV